MPIVISDKIISATPGGSVVDDTQVNDTSAGGSNIHAALQGVKEPRMLNTFFLASEGNDNNDGRNLQNAVATMGRAQTLSAAVTPTTDHKTIISYESRNFGDFINNTSIGNVANLFVEAREAVFENVDLTRKTNFLTRRVIGNTIMGSGSHFVIDGAVGHTNARTITFVAGAHNGTLVKIRELLDNVTISLAGITSGSTIRFEIDYYPVSDFEATMTTLLSTLPEGVKITGYIVDHVFGFTASSPPTYSVIREFTARASPSRRELKIGAAQSEFLGANFFSFHNDLNHWDTVFSVILRGIIVGSKLQATLTLDKYVTGVDIPSDYYFRVEGGTIVPTSNGIDTLPLNLFERLGSSGRLWVSETEIHSQLSNTSRTATIQIPNGNEIQTILTTTQDDPLLIIFNFPEFNVTVTSFEATMSVITNTGVGSDKWTDKVRVRFDKDGNRDNHYSMTLGTLGAYDDDALKVSDIFTRDSFHVELNNGNKLNQVNVNGVTSFDIAYMPNAQKLANIAFEIDVARVN